MKKRPEEEIGIIIPAYNEGKRVAEVLKKAKEFCPSIIVVDDGSEDKTAEVVRKMGIRVLRHEINLGKGAALKTGCEAAMKAGAKIIITLDADGQHNPEDIPRFIKAIRERQVDLVLGSRNLGFGMPLVRFLGNKIDSFLIGLFFGIYVTDPLCGFRALTREAYKKISWDSSGYGVETEMIARAGRSKLRFIEIPIETVYTDKYKGVSVLDAYKILLDILKWRFWQ